MRFGPLRPQARHPQPAGNASTFKAERMWPKVVDWKNEPSSSTSEGRLAPPSQVHQMSPTSPATSRPPQEGDLLVKFEIENFPAEYRDYYAAKRNNLFARIQDFPEMWDLYMKIDSIWMREFNDLQNVRETNRMLPLLLCMNAHAKIRVSIELAFMDSLAEARSILRDGIEFLANAHIMANDSKLQEIWLSKIDGKAALDAFNEAFIHNKKKGVFAGLNELHKAWGDLSETGSHANVTAMAERFEQSKSDGNIEWRLNYIGPDEMWATTVFTMLVTCSTMEKTLFNDYNSRLNLDGGLRKMRGEVERNKERLKNSLVSRFQLEPPGGITSPGR